MHDMNSFVLHVRRVVTIFSSYVSKKSLSHASSHVTIGAGAEILKSLVIYFHAMASDDGNSSLVAADSDEDIDWEEIDVSQPAEQQNIEITLQARPKQKQDKSDKSVHSICLIRRY